MNFRQGDEEYLLKLEKTLCDVNMTTMDFELVLTMKMMSNEEFHLDTTKDVGQEINDFEAILFPNDLQDFKIPLKKVLFCFKRLF